MADREYVMPPSEPKHETAISVLTETEAVHGWKFEVELRTGDAKVEEVRRVTVSLAWVDYEYWSHGTASPSRVVETVVRALLEVKAARDLPTNFDASTARRWHRELDQSVRELI